MTDVSVVALTNWDPLEGSIPPELASASVKRQIKNILKSYTGWFDPLSELLQNALDALEARSKRDSEHQPRLWVTVDLRANSVSVTDNGIGFTQDQFRSFLVPNVSFKKSQNRGNKGVGATYLAYGFNYLQVGTRSAGFSFIGSLRDGREWVEDETGTVGRPKVQQDTQALHDVFEGVDHGSTFTLRLGGEFVRPRDLRWLAATTAEQWEAVLRTKTPLGGIYVGDTPPTVECKIVVIDEDGRTTSRIVDSCEYLFPHTVFAACKRLDDMRAAQLQLIQQGKDASKLPTSFYNLNGLYNQWRADHLLDADSEFKSVIEIDDRELVTKHNVHVYAFFGYSTELWDLFNDNMLRLRKGKRLLLRGGLQLATNSMPQGELFLIPLTRNIGYQNVAHVIVHFDRADPDLGRKGFQPELQDLAKRIAVGAVNVFLNWRRHLRGDTGAPPDVLTGRAIHDWIARQEQHEREQPLVIKRKDFFLPTAEPSLTSEPLNEQDVVALFNQLLAGGVIRGIRVMSTSQHNQYDGVFRFVLTTPAEHHTFDKELNPLGIEEGRASSPFVSEPRILEYKFNVDALVEEFEKGEKSERDIKLVVAWTLGTAWSTRWIITPLLDLDNVHQRMFHGGTHLVRNAVTGDVVFPIVILSELIDYLNDVDGVQSFQKQNYTG